MALLHHPLKNAAPAYEESNPDVSSPLGIIPQHIRGCVNDFDQKIMLGTAFKKYDL